MSIRIGLGVSAFPFSSPRAYFRWIDLLERSGVDSVWQTDRLISTRPMLESMSAMAAIAGATERIKFGMNAVVASFRDPLVLAKQCATIDFLSGGRLLPVFGIGGKRAPEFRAHAFDARERGARVDEMLELLPRLWSGEPVDFEGRFFRYAGAVIAPRPVQHPLPVWIGGHSPAAIRRTARYGTGWIAGLRTPEQVAPIVRAIGAELAVVGRRIAPDHYGAGFPFRFGAWDDVVDARTRALSQAAALDESSTGGEPFRPERYVAVGDARHIAARCHAYVEAGVSKFVLTPIARDDEEMFDQTRRLIEEVMPLVEDRGADR